MKNILVVEDDFLLGKMYKKLLEDNGYAVFVRETAMEALSTLRENNFDLILLDIMLKGKMNGFDLLEIIKKDEKLAKIKTIVMTNLDDQEKISREIGADEYFIKSNTKPEAVVEKISKLI